MNKTWHLPLQELKHGPTFVIANTGTTFSNYNVSHVKNYNKDPNKKLLYMVATYKNQNMRPTFTRSTVWAYIYRNFNAGMTFVIVNKRRTFSNYKMGPPFVIENIRPTFKRCGSFGPLFRHCTLEHTFQELNVEPTFRNHGKHQEKEIEK